MTSEATPESTPLPDRAPQVLLDAGGESWERLGTLVARRMQELAPGEIMEIAGGLSGIVPALQAWCAEQGHALLRLVEDGERTSCWIGKGAAGAQGARQESD